MSNNQNKIVMNRLTKKVILRTEAKNKQGLAPLSLRMMVNGKRLNIPLHISIPPESWNVGKQMVLYGKGLEKVDVDRINDIIIKAHDSINRIQHHYNMMDLYATVDQVKEEFLQGKKTNNFVAYCKKHMKHISNTCVKGTQKSIQNAINKFELFAPKATFHELDLKLIARFDAFLKNNYKLSPATIWKHHKDIKMLINASIEDDSGIKNPYRHFKIARPNGSRDYLVKEELDQLQSLYDSQVLKMEEQEILRCFLFACRTGLRISDLLKITYENIIDEQLVFIPFKTRKAGKFVRVPLTESAKKLLVPKSVGLIFRTRHEQAMNRAMKVFALRCRIKKVVTFHVARHTFALSFLQSGGKVEVLQKLLGHGKIETTMVYVHVMNVDLREQMKLMDAV